MTVDVVDLGEKVVEGDAVAVYWYRWDGCPHVVQESVLKWISDRDWTASAHPAPMVMVHGALRQVKQDVCHGWREMLTWFFDHEVVVSYGDQSIVVWFNQMGPPLALM